MKRSLVVAAVLVMLCAGVAAHAEQYTYPLAFNINAGRSYCSHGFWMEAGTCSVDLGRTFTTVSKITFYLDGYSYSTYQTGVSNPPTWDVYDLVCIADRDISNGVPYYSPFGAPPEGALSPGYQQFYPGLMALDCPYSGLESFMDGSAMLSLMICVSDTPLSSWCGGATCVSTAYMVIDGTPTSVPEPSSVIALVGGLISLLAVRRRRA